MSRMKASSLLRTGRKAFRADAGSRKRRSADADVVITDTWASMGVESEKEIRQKAFSGYQVNR